MKITRKSPFTGQMHTMEIPLTELEFTLRHHQWRAGLLLQHAFHMLSADEREFIKTGITPTEWAETFPQDA